MELITFEVSNYLLHCPIIVPHICPLWPWCLYSSAFLKCSNFGASCCTPTKLINYYTICWLAFKGDTKCPSQNKGWKLTWLMFAGHHQSSRMLFFAAPKIPWVFWLSGAKYSPRKFRGCICLLWTSSGVLSAKRPCYITIVSSGLTGHLFATKILTQVRFAHPHYSLKPRRYHG